MTNLFSEAEAVTQWLDAYFAKQNTLAPRLLDAMSYSALNGGKRLRGCLVMASARLASQISGKTLNKDAALAVSGALEMLHAYSLIHDDLPAMDDAELRRGKPAAHLQFDEATAILAGDSLQTEAFSVLASLPSIRAENRIELVRILAESSGLNGMAGGQMLDLEAEEKQLTAPQIRQMQQLKTGALISASARMGAIIGDADNQLLEALDSYSDAIGYAFQIADDLLDVSADSAQIGKPAGRDAAQNKASIVSLMGIEKAKEMAEELVAQATTALEPYGATAQALNDLAYYIIQRKN